MTCIFHIPIGERFRIVSWPDRWAFISSLFTFNDASPFPGLIAPPEWRGGIKAPTYTGETFLIHPMGGHQERALELIITSVTKKGRDGAVFTFEAIAWCMRDGYRDMLSPMNELDPWRYFKGELNFVDGRDSWLERVEG